MVSSAVKQKQNKQIPLFKLGFWSSPEANFFEFDKHTAHLKTPTDKRQTSWLFTKRGGHDSGITQNKSKEWSERADLNREHPHANLAP